MARTTTQERTERRAAVEQMSRSGMAVVDIARELGVGPMTVQRDRRILHLRPQDRPRTEQPWRPDGAR